MSRFDAVFEELRLLQSRLKTTVNRLWFIKISLDSAYRCGHTESDFLPRRLVSQRKEAQEEYKRLLQCLNRLISSQLDSAFVVLNSHEDEKTLKQIRSTIRYIQNAFAVELPLRRTLARLNTLLPRQEPAL